MSDTVLVHFDIDKGPIGVWKVNISATGEVELQSYYAEDASASAANRGAATVKDKGSVVPWDAWFKRLTKGSPYFDAWRVYQVDPEDTLESVLLRIQEASKQ